MNCRKIQEILLTDHADGQLDDKHKCFVEEHLAQCHHCKEFAAIAQEVVIKPFINVKKQEVPAVIWDQVRAEILARQEKVVTGTTLFLVPFFNSPIPSLSAKGGSQPFG